MARARTIDEFDMTKLQKALDQRRRHSLQARPSLTKYSPAEIRSLHNSTPLSQNGSHVIPRGNSPITNIRMSNTTPPAEIKGTKTLRVEIVRTPSTNLPTPPETPRGLQNRTPLPIAFQHDYIHAPKPRRPTQADFVVSSQTPSRSSSTASWNYRGLTTYRGPEITRTGSLTMLQHPSPTIVSNPLSNYSRPRQSMINSGPERCNHERRDLRTTRSQSMTDISTESSTYRSSNISTDLSFSSPGTYSPHRHTYSPVPTDQQSMDVEKLPVSELETNTKEAAPRTVTSERVDSTIDLSANNQPAEVSSAPMEKPISKQIKKRFSFFQSKEKAPEVAAELKKPRRRSVSLTKNPELIPFIPKESQTIDQSKDKVELPASLNEFDNHPVMRPLSLVIPTDDIHRDRSSHSAPGYGRCACCGKLKRPRGMLSSELSPVLENENVRPKFSLEVDRQEREKQQIEQVDSDPLKSVPTIPLEVGRLQGAQKGFESPMTSSERFQRLESGGLKLRNRPLSEEPRIVRFASLRGKPEDDLEIAEEEKIPVVVVDSEPDEDVINMVNSEVTQKEVIGLELISVPYEKLNSSMPKSAKTSCLPVASSRPITPIWRKQKSSEAANDSSFKKGPVRFLGSAKPKDSTSPPKKEPRPRSRLSKMERPPSAEPPKKIPFVPPPSPPPPTRIKSPPPPKHPHAAFGLTKGTTLPSTQTPEPYFPPKRAPSQRGPNGNPILPYLQLGHFSSSLTLQDLVVDASNGNSDKEAVIHDETRSRIGQERISYVDEKTELRRSIEIAHQRELEYDRMKVKANDWVGQVMAV